CRIGIDEFEQDALRTKPGYEPAHFGCVAIRDRTVGAREEEDDRLDAGGCVERIDLAALGSFDANLRGGRTRQRDHDDQPAQHETHETTKARNENRLSLVGGST